MTKQENLIGYKFTILSEDVASQDLFEDKTHERVSENLYKIIQDSTKGVTIGLEGSWGSGKSTVIKLLKDKLAKKPEDKTLFFMFDAWAHDGDPLRRIFLESLIREIDPSEKDADLNAIKGKITGRKKVVEVKAKKSTSRLGKWISLSALFIPLGSAFLGKVNYDIFVWPWSDQAHHPYGLFIFGLLLCLSPVLVLLWWRFWGDKENDKVSWEFFSVDTREDYTQDITEDGERTSIEFEDHFKCIIQTAIEKGLIERCIVVIDNLDRVDSDHAKNIWSTLQTFFQKRSNGNTGLNWSDKLWFVIPFDYEGFLKIWDSNDGNSEIGKSFLKKCFQLIAEVPHPVMSGWSKYAETCINEALNQWPDYERASVLSTYVRYASRLDRSPTPRDIKVFVNQIGLLGAMWGREISAEAICLYALFKESFSTNDLRASLIAGKLPNLYQTDSDLSDICAELAGLIFGVNKRKGLQLLLAPEIQAAFKAGDGAKLSSLVEHHDNAFWIAYEASKNQWMLNSGHTDELKIAFTKAIHTGLLQYKNKIKRDVDRLVNIWIEVFPELNFDTFDYSASIKQALDLYSDKDFFLEKLNDLTKNRLKEIVLLVGNEKFPEKSLVNFIEIIKLLKIEGKPITRSYYSKLNFGNWKFWLDAQNRLNINLDVVLPKKETIIEIATETQFSSAHLNDDALKYLIETYQLYPEPPEWESVANQIVTWFNLRSRNYECENIYAFALTLYLGTNKNISSKIKSCVEGELFWTCSQQSTCTANPSLPILAALCVEDEIQNHRFVSTEVKSFWSKDIDLTEPVICYNMLKKLEQIDILWILSKDKRNIAAIKIVRNSNDKNLYSSWAGTAYIDEFSWADDKEIKILAEKLISNGSFLNCQSRMQNKQIPYQGVYKIFHGLKDDKVNAFIDDEISKVTKENWLKCIAENGTLLELVKDKNPHFSDAIKECLTSIASGENTKIIHTDLIDKIPYFLKKTADLEKSIIPKVIEAYFDSDKDNFSEELFNKINPFFIAHLSNVNEVKVMERLNLWIDNNARTRIDWLVNQNIASFNNPLEGLVGRIQSGLKNKDELAVMINERFKIGVTIPEEDDQK